MTTTATTEHTCHGAVFCGQPRAAAQAACAACTPPARPLLEVLGEHVDQVNARRSAALQQNAAVDRRVAELRTERHASQRSNASSDFTRDPGRPELHENDCPRGDADSLGTPCTCRATGCPCECHTSGGGDDCCANAGR